MADRLTDEEILEARRHFAFGDDAWAHEAVICCDELQALRALCLRWNRAAGTECAGSEYIDDPERVFARVREARQAEHVSLLNFARRANKAEAECDALAARVAELEGVPNPLAELEAWLREDYARQVQMSVSCKNAAVLLSFSASDEDFRNKVVTTVIGTGPDLPSALAEALRKAKEERCFLHY